MNKSRLMHRSTVLACVLNFTAAVCAQEQPSRPPAPVDTSRIPSAVRLRLARLGQRFDSAERLRMNYAGVLTTPTGQRPLQLTWQWPGLIRIEEGGISPRAVSFDGSKVTASAGTVDSLAQALLSSLGFDLPENLFRLSAEGVPMRLLAAWAQIGTGYSKSYSGAFVDVVQVFPPPTGFESTHSQAKLFTFDSRTGFPYAVSYRNSRDEKVSVVQTRFHDWKTTAGLSTPSEITRTEDGVETFRFQVVQTTTGDAQPASAFKH